MASSETKIDGVVVVQMSTTGSSYLTPALMYGGLSGSLQNLVNGASYLVAGANVTITSQSNGQIVIAAASSGGGSTSTGFTNPYGTGTDGSALLDGTNTFGWASKSGNTYTQTRDVYLTSLTVSGSVTLLPAGYRTYVSGACVVSGTVSNNGGDGSNGGGGSQGPGGTGGAAGVFLGGTKGGGNDGAAEDQPFGIFTVNAVGGPGRSGPGGPWPYKGGLYTGSWEMVPMGTVFPSALNGVIYSAAGTSLSVGGGSGGAYGSQGSGGGGGGVIAIMAKSLTVIAGGSITANGGQNDPNNWGGNGGGGLVILVTSASLSNAGTISANAGTGGGGNGAVGKVITATLTQ